MNRLAPGDPGQIAVGEAQQADLIGVNSFGQFLCSCHPGLLAPVGHVSPPRSGRGNPFPNRILLGDRFVPMIDRVRSRTSHRRGAGGAQVRRHGDS
jgi:hypothetical protein